MLPMSKFDKSYQCENGHEIYVLNGHKAPTTCVACVHGKPCKASIHEIKRGK